MAPATKIAATDSMKTNSFTTLIPLLKKPSLAADSKDGFSRNYEFLYCVWLKIG
jgi:hypothetical protein